MKEVLGVATVILSIAGHTPYIIDTWRGKTKPHLFTWLTLSIIVSLAFVGQWVSGAAAGSWSTGITGVIVIIIALLALRKGTKDVTKLDKYCFIAALLTIIPWYITKNPVISIILLSIIDSLALIPTIRKTINDPTSETLVMYAVNLLRHSLSILAISQYNVATVFYPAYLLAMNLFIVIVIRRPHLFRNITLRFRSRRHPRP